MRGMNHVTLVGRLGRDPEIRRPAGDAGTPWCVLSVATEHGEKNGDTWQNVTDWHRVKIFGRDAERCERLGVGSLVGVEGSLVYERWVDKDGMRRQTPVIRAESISFLSTPARAEETVEVDAQA